PPTRSYRNRGASHRRYDYGRHRPDWRPGPYRPGGEEIVLIDCGGNPGTGAVEDAVRRVRPGGTLVIRARGGACVGWLNIDKPMTIIGEAGFDVRRGVRGEPTLMAPDGLPCVTVAQGVRVEFRDMVFAAPRAGDAACIVGYGGEIVMNRVGMTYAGDEAAIYADGGLVDLRDVAIDAQTVAAAVVADGATLTTDEVLITGAQSGIEVTAGNGPPTRINRTRLLGPERPNNFGPRSIGLLVEARRDYGEIAITNSKICGYPDAVSVEGATVRVDRTRICKAQKGVIVYNGEVNVDHSRIVAEDTGVLVVSGNGRVTNSILAGMARPVDYERGQVFAENNHVWSQRWEECRPRFERRYGNRYAPVWGPGRDPGYACHGDPYPRQWWARDEQSLNVPYDPRVAYPDAWDRYSGGQGWYDCNRRYVSDNRYSFDDRWRRGPRGWSRECPRQPGEPFFDWGFDARIGISVHAAPPPPPSYDIDFDSGFDFGL
ncbi:MAG: hypothetical protein ACXW3O_10730, partial [Brevundimonas sp.]